MSRQDKATTEKHAHTLRELVKRPENKVCADCKRNDPRWASWNIGVFLCIRCSGIHRGMGTHISKVKSVDLDVWTPEQMESIKKWGNRRANLYWEAHLKSGHVPPEHKIDSFIRSKYESRRWAKDGPLPSDPSLLEQGASPSIPQAVSEPCKSPAPSLSHRSFHAPASSISDSRPALPVTTSQPQSHQLLSETFVNPAPANLSTATGASALVQPTKADNDLFSLDFHVPTSTMMQNNASSAQPKKDVKQDILSLFSTQIPGSTNPIFNSFPSQHASSPWANPQPTSMMGTGGIGAWGANSGWMGVPPSQPNLWSTSAGTSIQPQQSSLFDTSDVWNAPSSTSQNRLSQDIFSTTVGTTQTNKKDDIFGDLWGGSK